MVENKKLSNLHYEMNKYETSISKGDSFPSCKKYLYSTNLSLIQNSVKLTDTKIIPLKGKTTLQKLL